MSLEQALNFLIPLLALVVGFFLKRNPAFNNKFIPVASLILAAAIRLGTELGVPTVAAQETAVAYAGFWGSFGGVFLKALLDAIIATGLHSGAKNLKEAAR